MHVVPHGREHQTIEFWDAVRHEKYFEQHEIMQLSRIAQSADSGNLATQENWEMCPQNLLTQHD